MICEVKARSVAHEAHSMLEVCPWRYLSAGGSGFSSCTGVGHLEKGFEEGLATLSIDVLCVLVVWPEDVLLLLWLEK